MNDQSQMMNQMNMNPVQMMNQSQAMSQMMNQHPVQPPLMMNRTYKPWQQQQQQVPPLMKSNFGNSKPNRSNWKGKKVNSEINNKNRRIDKPNPNSSLGGVGGGGGGTIGYNPPTLHELQSQNRLKARKFYPKKKFNNRFAPYAPRNTTSFIIRAKKAGGIASLVSPCPVTPAVLPTPIFSPSREILGDTAKEEWGVDGYGSMKGLIRLRSPPGNDIEVHDDEDEDEGNGSSESDVEEHVEVERRLDHDLSRFEMIYPSYGGGGGEYNNVLENRVDDQDSHIAQLEEENLTLKERLFLMERELGDLRRRMQFLERRTRVDVNEEVVENESENDSEGGSDVRGGRGTGSDNNNNNNHHHQEVIVEGVGDVCMEEFVPDQVVAKEDENVGNEIVSDKLVGKDDMVAKDAMNVGNDIVLDKLVANVDTDESKGEEGEKEVLGNEIVAEKIDNESKGGEAGNEFVREQMNVEQHRMVAVKED